MAHQGFVFAVFDIAGIVQVAAADRVGIVPKGSQVLAAGNNKSFIRVSGGNFPHPAVVFVLGQAAQRIVIVALFNAGQLVKDCVVLLGALHMFPTVIGQPDFGNRMCSRSLMSRRWSSLTV